MSLKHAKRFTASGADRWVNCPGSVLAEQGLPDITSEAAIEGTRMHEILCKLVLRSIYGSLNSFPDLELSHLSDSTLAYLYNALNYIMEINEDGINIEKKVDFSLIAPQNCNIENDFFGTADYIKYDIEKRVIHVIDFKWGMCKVPVENNFQLILYTLGILNKERTVGIKFDKIEIHIVQPRINYYASQTLTLEELESWQLFFKEAVKKALNPDAIRIPTKVGCKYCKARFTCPALLELTKKTYELASPFAKSEMDDDDYRFILDNASLIKKFIDEVEERILNTLKEGGELKGYTLSTSSRSKWTEEAKQKLTEILGDGAYEKKLISITKARNFIPKDFYFDIESLITKEEKLNLTKEN